MNAPEILIVGATGNVGSELTSLFARDAISTRVLLRPGSTSRLPNCAGTETVQGDLADSESIKAALEGIRKVFLLTRDHPRQGELEANLVELAVRAGVEKIVKSSAFAAGLVPPIGYGIPHAESEQKLIASGINWIILRPYMFMQNFLEIADLIKSRGILPFPLGTARIGLIDARDVALVAKAVLTCKDFDNEILELTGPEILSLSECADILADVLGRPVRYRSPPSWLAGLMMRVQGASPWDIAMRKQLFSMIRDGGEEGITNEVERATGKTPRSVETFVRENLHLFQ